MSDIQSKIPKNNAGNDDKNLNPIISKWAKDTFSNINLSTIYEKKELQRLNSHLQKYLDDVKESENLNTRLIDDLKATFENALDLMDKSQIDKQIENVRYELENESNEAIKLKIRFEEKVDEIEQTRNRLKFFQNENDIHRNKEYMLKNLLSDLQLQKEHLANSNRLAEDDIKKELNHIIKAETNLAELRKELSESRCKSKELEFEMQTLLEDMAFKKAVHEEEINYLKSKIPIGSGAELNNFYKNELRKAVREIRQDFHALNDQQLNDYKQFKENELNVAKFNMNQYKTIVEQQGERLNLDLNNANAKDLETGFNKNSNEMKLLDDENKKLFNRLKNLENQLVDRKNLNAERLIKLQNDIYKLKEQNDGYEHERNYLSQMIKTKLDFEIQVYRSILNYQGKIINDSKQSNLAEKIQGKSNNYKASINEYSATSSYTGSPNLLKILSSISTINNATGNDSNNTSVADDETISNVSYASGTSSTRKNF